MKDELFDKITAPNRDFTPMASAYAYEQFLTSQIYHDFLGEINARIEDMRDFYETCDSKKYLETRGGLTAMRMIAGIFKDLHNNSQQSSAMSEEDNG